MIWTFFANCSLWIPNHNFPAKGRTSAKTGSAKRHIPVFCFICFIYFAIFRFSYRFSINWSGKYSSNFSAIIPFPSFPSRSQTPDSDTQGWNTAYRGAYFCPTAAPYRRRIFRIFHPRAYPRKQNHSWDSWRNRKTPCPFYLSWQKRVNRFHPDNGGKSPEETIQQVNSSSQIKRDLTIIPEHCSKGNLRKNTAYVFICAPEYCSEKEYKPITLITVSI